MDEKPSSAAAAPAALGSGFAQVSYRILIECRLASGRAEIERLALVVALELGQLFVDRHLAYRINCHFLSASINASI